MGRWKYSITPEMKDTYVELSSNVIDTSLIFAVIVRLSLRQDNVSASNQFTSSKEAPAKELTV